MHPVLKAFLMLGAGAGAFYGAAQWARPGAAAADADGDIAAPVERPALSASAAGPARSTPEADAVALLSRRRSLSDAATAFAPMNWQPPPPPPPAPVTAPPPPPPAPPPPPSAPPLPFAFVGMAERGADRPQAYLAKGEALLVVSVGDIVENQTYRIDALSPTGVVLTYLPLNKQQTLNVPGGSP